jgi:hypothetical protein
MKLLDPLSARRKGIWGYSLFTDRVGNFVGNSALDAAKESEVPPKAHSFPGSGARCAGCSDPQGASPHAHFLRYRALVISSPVVLGRCGQILPFDVFSNAPVGGVKRRHAMLIRLSLAIYR